MKRVWRWICILGLLTALPGCSGEDGALADEAFQAVAFHEFTDEPQKLVITTYLPLGSSEPKLQAFMDLHPEVAIEIENPTGNDYFLYREYLKTALMSGSGGDLVEITGDGYIDFGGSPYLMDLNMYMAADGDFQREDYYETVLDAMAVNGRLPILSSVFELQYAGVNTAYPQAVAAFAGKDKITMTEMLHIYEETVDGKEEGDALYIMPDYNVRRIIFSPEFVDFNKGIARYNTQDFYNRAKQALDLTVPGADHYRLELSYYLPEFYEARDYLFAGVTDDDRRLFLPFEEPYIHFEEYRRPIDTFTDFKPMANEAGNLLMLPGGNQLGINASAENPGLAWEFLKYYVSSGPEVVLGDIIKQNYLHKETNRQAILNTYRNIMTEQTGISPGEAQEETFEDILAFFESNLEKPLKFEVYPFREDLEEVGMKLHNGELTPEQAGEQLQGMVGLIMME